MYQLEKRKLCLNYGKIFDFHAVSAELLERLRRK